MLVKKFSSVLIVSIGEVGRMGEENKWKENGIFFPLNYPWVKAHVGKASLALLNI